MSEHSSSSMLSISNFPSVRIQPVASLNLDSRFYILVFKVEPMAASHLHFYPNFLPYSSRASSCSLYSNIKACVVSFALSRFLCIYALPCAYRLVLNDQAQIWQKMEFPPGFGTPISDNLTLNSTL